MNPTESKVLRRSLRFSLVAGGIGAVTGCAVLIGWSLDVTALKSIGPGYVAMTPNAALCFLLLGIALIARSPLLRLHHLTDSTQHAIASACAAAVALVAGTTLYEYIADARFAMDTWLLPDTVRGSPVNAGRMSRAAAGVFLVLAGAMLGIQAHSNRGIRLAQSAAVLATLMGFTGVLAYVYDVGTLYRLEAASNIALHGTVLTALLGAGVLLLKPDRGLMSHITSLRVGGTLARALLPIAVVVPLAFGWLRLWGQHAGWYGTELGLAIFAAANVLVFAFVVWRTARALNRMHAIREASERASLRSAAELELAGSKLRESQELHRVAITAAGLGTWRQDVASGELECSDVYRSLYGLAANTPVTRAQLLEIVHPDDRALILGIRQNVTAGVSKFEVEFRVVLPDGSTRWLATKGEASYGRAGQALSVNGVTMDVTARKALEEDRERIRRQLNQSKQLSALGTLSAGIAHDFNNLLAAISGNAALMRDELPRDHPSLGSLREIDKAARRATDLVQRILTFSRAQEVKPVAMRLEPVVEEVVNLLRTSLPPQIELHTGYAADLPNVRVDPTQMHQVIMNLATNAIHAIADAPGLIEVAIDAIDARTAGPSAPADLEPGRYVRLMVRDNGCGMDQVVAERIFEPFYTTKGPGRGTGLGLAMVHGIVTQFGGAISVQSARGRGTTFEVYLPATRETAALPSNDDGTQTFGQGQRVLYVDDEDALVFLVTRALERLNYRIFGYTDAAQALAVFRGSPDAFDAIVTDIAMPGMSGFDLAREALAIRPDIPIVVTSGYVRREDAELAERLGIRHLIDKPSSVEALSQALATHFREETARQRRSAG